MGVQTLPELVGHRGWPVRFPENFLEGFAAAVSAGACWLECDVQVSADGVPFVCHDVSLKRTANLDRDITHMRATELDVVSIGERQRFGEQHAGARLPRLDALIAWLESQSHVTLFVEIKRESLLHHGTAAVVGRVMDELRVAPGQCSVISFDHDCLVHARNLGAPTIGWAVESVTDEIRRLAKALNPDYLFTDERVFADIHAALPGPWQWVPYHTEDARRAMELARHGATLVETNDIGGLLQAAEFIQT
ncbi:MAG TPA: glycerophosphodiester phosphodiesterase family protein [Dokdonella sp.]|uniref:glycerophosphodiester phosphodiesterase family protein n=1 Tax=Dokdonella sp. TaxID=2291710 RepID=UPI002D7F5689|nr:glycerophosphodiester phosphodiesterase family protein [Dokdonella sp.]HET9032801.1 glycerophosphodiester phosphodiesterase family protein [Dokdonella sp.]